MVPDDGDCDGLIQIRQWNSIKLEWADKPDLPSVVALNNSYFNRLVLMILASYVAKIAEICNLWTF